MLGPHNTTERIGSHEAIQRRRGFLRAAGDAAGSLSLRRSLRRREGGGTSGLFARWVCRRVRVEGDAAEAVAVVSRRNKFLRAPFAVRRGFCLRLGASGVGDPRVSSRSRALVAGGPSALAVWVLRWAMDAGRRRPYFFLVGMICCRCSSPSSALMLVGDPALSGRMARPRCWTGRMTRVLFLPEGTLFAVLKAKDGDGCCRCVGLMSMPSQRWCQERRKQRGGNVPRSKMMTCLRLVADPSAAGVFSQDSGMMTQDSGALFVLWLS